jgi:NAD dependent epimerase/dehydratase family enzyme
VDTIDDLCGIYIKAIEDSNMQGAYNAVADEHINNENFTKNLTQLLQKPFWKFNIPSILMKIFFGKMSNILLKGSRVSNQKIKENGYKFVFSSVDNALKGLKKSK